FQAEDGIRDRNVTGVQTCALPISGYMKNTDQLSRDSIEYYKERTEKLEMEKEALVAKLKWYEEQFRLSQQRRFGSSSEKTNSDRSEERRVGKERRTQSAMYLAKYI